MTLTAERLRELLDYDPKTGVFTWLVNRGPFMRCGDVAGYVTGNDYRRIGVDGHVRLAHRLAWLWMTGEWPPREIDHINLMRWDNRWCNLREATPSQNHANLPVYKNNTSGFKGVTWDKRKRKWMAQIQIGGGNPSFLGYYSTAEKAHESYCAAAFYHSGEYARTM